LKRPRRNWSGKGLSSERSRRERKKGNESGGASVAVEVASCAADIEDVEGGRIRLSVSGMGVHLRLFMEVGWFRILLEAFAGR
jgi:hypothetical protein